MSGGHFNKLIQNQKKHVYLPSVKRLGGGFVQFLHKVSNISTTESKDPTLISKPVDEKVKGKSHETDRQIKTSLLQSGSGNVELQTNDSETILTNGSESFMQESSDDSDDPSFHEENELEVQSHLKPPEIKRKTEETNETVPKKKFKTYSFKIRD